MTDPARPRCYRRIARWLYRLSACGLIVMALTSILVSQLLPLAERHPEVIARWLSERAGVSIQFDQIHTGWTRRGPLLQLDGLRIGEGEDAVRIGQTEILIAQYAGLLPGRSFSELRLRGLHLTLERLGDGRWQVRGLPGQAANDGDPLSALGRLGELQVIGARLGLHAPALGIDTSIPDVDLRVRVAGARVRIALNARMTPDAAPLRAALDLDRHHGNASAYAAIHEADLAAWSPLLRLDGLMLANGEGQIETWAQLQAYRLSTLTTLARFDHLLVQRLAAADEPAEQVAFGQVQAHLTWQHHDGQWQLHAPQLRIGDPMQPQVLDGLLLAGGREQMLSATRIDAGPLLAIAALSPRLPPALRQWLKAAKPDAIAHEIALSGSGDHGLRGRVRVDNLHFSSVDDIPGVHGLGGAITLDMHGAVVDIDPEATVQFDWPTGFGAPHHLRLHGELAAWWEADGVRLQTPALRIDAEEGYAADVRGGLWFHLDGRRPRIDMAAALDDTRIPVAKRFWVRHQMSPEAVEWLDMALVSGTLRNGRALVSGELADWPFDSRQGEHVRGVFDAQGDLSAARVRFQPDWPLMEALTGPVRFVNDGFSVRGSARLGKIALRDIRARLGHYSGDQLTIHAQASGDMQDWLTLLRQSPLQGSHGDVLDHLDASGTATSSVQLNMALGSGRGPEIAGHAELDGVRLQETRWELDFNDVRGTVNYDQHGFASEHLAVAQTGQRGSLSLRAGAGHVITEHHAFEAELQLQLAAADLIARVPPLDWLRTHLGGQSHWTAALAINADNADNTPASGLLTLQSNLFGTTLTLPAPLAKPAGLPLPARVIVPLPWDTGEIQVALGERLALRTRTRSEHTGIRIALGQHHVHEPAPDNGLIVTGQVPELAASDWATLGAFTSTEGDAPAPQLDVQIGQLHLLGAQFADITLSTRVEADTTILHLESPALSGDLHWPDTPAAALKADFRHLHWPQLTHANGSPATAPAPTSTSTTDPRQLPELDLHIADLRLGGWPLGEASLRTRKTGTGFEIDHLNLRGPQQTITLRGSWNGSGDSASTQLELDLDSQNIGPLLTALGLGQQLRGGSGSLRLSGHWPGSPMAFAAARLTGQMQVDLRDGQLLEVEPGAGRVLGLLSVAQLPRRLLLDFRDFFGKGFGFNEIGGEIHVADGIAHTDGLRINGPAAKIRISGSSNLHAQTHDQTIDVAPRTGNLLTAVGAFAGGPLGAAVGAAANAVLKRPLSNVGGKTYHVTGSWQEPKVDVVNHEMVVNVAAEDSNTEERSGDGVNAGDGVVEDHSGDILHEDLPFLEPLPAPLPAEGRILLYDDVH